MSCKEGWIYLRHYISNPIAHCEYHNCDMNVKRIKDRSCLSKENTGCNCRHLEKYENHPYWVMRDVIKSRYKNKGVII